jgi:hypothetical protein
MCYSFCGNKAAVFVDLQRGRITNVQANIIYCKGDRYSYSLRAGRPGIRNVGKARFYIPVHRRSRGPPNLVYSGYRVHFSGVKRPERGVDRPLPSSAEVENG